MSIQGIHFYEFCAEPLDKLNRKGIPYHNERGFRSIHELDWICKSAGEYFNVPAEELKRVRLPFSPLLSGRWIEHAETLFRIGDCLVHNTSDGNPYADIRTVVFVGNPGDIVQKHVPYFVIERYAQYYCKEPTEGLENIAKSLMKWMKGY
jgi:hypothetical protein